MKKKVILYKKIPEIQKIKLENNFKLIYFENINKNNYYEFTKELKDAEGVIGTGVRFDKKLIEVAQCLKVISTVSVGYDNFDLNELNKRKIRLMNTPDVLTDTTADLIFSLVLATARRIPELDYLVRNGGWKSNIREEHYGIDIHHKTMGILGMGRIGKALAKRAFCGFDMKVLYWSREPKFDIEQQYEAKYCDLDNLLKHSDFVCITLPLSKSTEKLIDARKLALMKPSAILINGSRGQIIDESSLVKALQQKTIFAAGLDVFSIEPLPKNSPLSQLPNVILLPHIGSATYETRMSMIDCAINNLITALAPPPPSKNWVNPEAG